MVRELLTDKNNTTLLNDRDRERLAFLSTDFPHSPGGGTAVSPRRPLGTIQELSASLLSPSDFSYDKTDEDLDLDGNTTFLRSGRKWKRPSAPPMEVDEDITPPGKKHKRSKSGGRKHHRRSRSAGVATVTLSVRDDEIPTDRGKRRASGKRRLKKSFSTTNTKQFGSESEDENVAPRHHCRHQSEANTPPNPWSSGLRHYNSAGKSLNRVHSFVSKTVIRPETCIPCGKRIKFGRMVMKCKDCRATAHPECKDLLPLPCCPNNTTPGAGKHNTGLLADYAPSDPPMIPALVIHCVNEIEARGLSEVGIYRVPGAEKQVKDLKEKFLCGKGTPFLGSIDDIHVVCGCLKDFLRSLKESLITYGLWNDFVNATETRDEEEGLSMLYHAVSQLPQPNRDTLAFVMLHLQRVSECGECKMSVSNLARVFGPTVVGYSTTDPEPLQMIEETRKQQKVIEKLMSISTDYWITFINISDDMECPGAPYTPKTPESRPVPHSMLGPVDCSTQGTEKKSGWFTPRFGSRGSRSTKTPTRFFSSPILK
ncbi:Rac GTPase-activating protein 1 [Lamellibrachia satsuma]|nr:Rac GTPase-activating protein 1 [Lamellibrachia satsuma]